MLHASLDEVEEARLVVVMAAAEADVATCYDILATDTLARLDAMTAYSSQTENK